MKITKIIIIIIIVLLLCIGGIFAQGRQNISGRAYDEASHAPLAGVVVRVAGMPALGTATDADGKFTLAEVPIGRRTLAFSYTGYEEKVLSDVLVTAGKEVYVEVAMQEGLHKLQEVTVHYDKAADKTRTNNDMAQVSARSFNVDETKRYAGSLGDPSRMAANFAGVVSGNDSRNDIVVRGNSPAGMLWQLEGLNIPNPNHYGSLSSTGGPVSMLNNNNIAKSDFLTSAFPAQYGNAVAGVFDMKLREGNSNKGEYLGQIGFNGFELGAEGPVGVRKRTSYLVNYRYSTLGVFQKIGINFGTGAAVPIYQDINFKVVSNIGKRSKFSLFGLGGNSKIDFLGKDVDTTKGDLYGDGDPYANERNKFGMGLVGLAWEYRISDRTFSRLTVGYSATLQQYSDDSLSHIDYTPYLDAAGKFTTGKASVVWMLMHKVNVRNSIQSGFTFDQTGFNLVNKDYFPDGSSYTYIDRRGSYGLAQAYTQWKHRYNEKLSSVAGLHGQYMTLNKTLAVEPRISVRYALPNRQAISAGYGLHHQVQNIYTYFVSTYDANGAAAFTNHDLGFTRSQHVVLTYDWNITDHLRMKAEAYCQWLSRVPVEQRATSFSALNTGADFGMSDVDSLANKGVGRNYGMELTVERFFDRGYYFLATGSLFNSRYKGSDGVERNTTFNTNYVVNLLGGKEFRVGKKGSVLAVNLRLSTVGGRYITPVDINRSRAEGKNVYHEDLAYSLRQSPYFRTDLRIAYRKEYRRSTLEMAIDFQNLTNHQNVFAQYYDTRSQKVVTTYQQSFFPVPTIRFTF